MSIGKSLLPELEHEMANTRKAFERLPEDKLQFKPDPTSMSLGRLAGHILEMVGWGTLTIQTEELELAPEGKPAFQPIEAKSRKQVLEEFDKSAAGFKAALASASDATLMKNWRLLNNGQEMLSMPKIGVIRGMILNHLIHHRGQLMVYYRMNGVPVPGLYGPSADEGRAAVA